MMNPSEDDPFVSLWQQQYGSSDEILEEIAEKKRRDHLTKDELDDNSTD